MSAKLIFSLLCDDAREEKTGKLTVVGLYNYVIGFQSPANWPSVNVGTPIRYGLPQLCIVRRWANQTGGEKTSTEIIGPDETVKAKIETVLIRPQDEAYCQEIIKLFGLPLQEGLYKIRTTCGSMEFDDEFVVKVLGEAQMPQQAQA